MEKHNSPQAQFYARHAQPYMFAHAPEKMLTKAAVSLIFKRLDQSISQFPSILLSFSLALRVPQVMQP